MRKQLVDLSREIQRDDSQNIDIIVNEDTAVSENMGQKGFKNNRINKEPSECGPK